MIDNISENNGDFIGWKPNNIPSEMSNYSFDKGDDGYMDTLF